MFGKLIHDDTHVHFVYGWWIYYFHRFHFCHSTQCHAIPQLEPPMINKHERNIHMPVLRGLNGCVDSSESEVTESAQLCFCRWRRIRKRCVTKPCPFDHISITFRSHLIKTTCQQRIRKCYHIVVHACTVQTASSATKCVILVCFHHFAC